MESGTTVQETTMRSFSNKAGGLPTDKTEIATIELSKFVSLTLANCRNTII